MTIRKIPAIKNEQKSTGAIVGNSTNLWGQEGLLKQKEILQKTDFKLNPYLIAAIVRRKPSNIKLCIDPKVHFKNSTDSREMLHKSQYEALAKYYGALLTNPVKLAMKICDTDTWETTQVTDPTRFDVLHCLAKHWDLLVESSHQKDHPVPDLEDILNFARDLNTHIPLHIFILGLSEKNKEKAAEILKAKVPPAEEIREKAASIENRCVSAG